MFFQKKILWVCVYPLLIVFYYIQTEAVFFLSLNFDTLDNHVIRCLIIDEMHLYYCLSG